MTTCIEKRSISPGLARAEIDIVRSPRAPVGNGAKVGMSRHIMLLDDAGSQLFEH